MKELAARISAHLKRFEADPEINRHAAARREQDRTVPYYTARAFVAGAWIGIVYVSYQGATNVPRADAERYLAKLDAGFVGRHFEALRESVSK